VCWPREKLSARAGCWAVAPFDQLLLIDRQKWAASRLLARFELVTLLGEKQTPMPAFLWRRPPCCHREAPTARKGRHAPLLDGTRLRTATSTA